MSDSRNAVERGAALLDLERPGWEREIDVPGLHLGVCESCVIGQLFGDYNEGLAELDGLAAENPEHFGFDGRYRQYATLTRLWRVLIRERLRS